MGRERELERKSEREGEETEREREGRKVLYLLKKEIMFVQVYRQ